MEITLKWNNGVVQTKTLITHKCQMKSKKIQYFMVGSPLYNAIEDGTFSFDLGFGVYSFEILNPKS